MKDLVERGVKPGLENYARTAPRTSKKGIRLPGWPGTLIWREVDDSYEIHDEERARRAVEAQFGLDKAIEMGVVKVKQELSKSGLSEHLKKLGLRSFDGTNFVEKHDTLTIREA
jgi:hypothetical protein